MLRCSSAISFLGLCLFVVGSALADDNITPLQRSYRGALPPSDSSKAKNCGPNCLFLLLKAGGFDCSLPAIVRDCAPNEKGVSIQTLHEVAQKYGLRTSVVRTGPSELVGAAPAIALLSEKEGEGHFIVVCGADGTRVQVVDGTTGQLVSITKASLERQFSGYALVTEASKSTWSISRNLIVFITLVLACVVVAFLRKGTISPQVQAILLMLTFSGSIVSVAGGQETDIATITSKMRQSQEQFWSIPGGAFIRYTMEIKQPEDKPVLVWRDGVQGEFVFRGDEFRTKNIGDLRFQSTDKVTGKSTTQYESTIRDAYYNFKSNEGVTREGNDLAQITGYRHSFTESTNFIFKFMFFEKSSVHYGSDQFFTNHSVLPGGFEKMPDIRAEVVTENGDQVVLLTHKTQKIWLQPKHGYAPYRRQFFSPDGDVYEEFTLSMYREIAPDAWLPERLRKTLWMPKDYPDGTPMFEANIRIDGTVVGKVTSQDLTVVLDSKIAVIEDQIANEVYRTQKPGDDSFDKAAQFIRKNAPGRLDGLGSKYFFALIAIMVGALSVVAYLVFRWRKGHQE